MLGRLVQLFSDAYFKVGTLDTAQLVSANNVPVFQYRSELNKLLLRVLVCKFLKLPYRGNFR